MYRIICETDGKIYPLLDLRDNKYIVQNPKLTLELNKTGSLTFYMNLNHPCYGCIKKITSIISVLIVRKNGSEEWLYSGRSMTDEEDFYRTGKIECEGILAFLIDSIVRDYSFKGTPEAYFRYLITQHNAHVGSEKQFQFGTIDLEGIDNNETVVRESKQKPNTFAELNSKVIDLFDCYVSARNVDGVYYIDCVKDIGNTNTQDIRYGVNLLDLKKTVSATELYTVMIGIGASDQNGNKISMEVVDDDAVALYGRIEGTVEYSDVTQEKNLRTKTIDYLKQHTGYNRTIEAYAVDLNLVDEENPDIRLGYINVYSEPHGLEEKMLISKMEIDLMNPESSKYTLGLSQSGINGNNGISEVKKDIQKISAGSGGTQYLQEDTVPLTDAEISKIIKDATA